jgi:hypothetical protein
MVFVHNAPSAVDFSQTHRQPKFQRFPLAVRIYVGASSHRRRKRNVLASGDPDIVETKGKGFSDDEKNVSQVAM